MTSEICLRKFEVSFEKKRKKTKKKRLFSAIEKSAEHIIHCLPCSYLNDILELLP